jgi:hypothetical protein
MIFMSSLPLARTLPSKDQETVLTQLLPFSNKSVSMETALRLSLADRAKHERKMQSPVALQAQNFRSCLCADEMDAPICGPSRDDVAGGPIFHAPNCRVKARRVPSARSVVVPQDEIHDVCLAVEQPEQTHPKQYARVAVPGCMARSAVARTRRHVAERAPGGSILRRAFGVPGHSTSVRGGVF